MRILVFIVLLLLPAICQAQAVSSKDLITKANELDGETVVYKGEAITAVMKRGERSWINIHDGYNAIGVWCLTENADEVKSLGDYKHEGDILEVTGVFHRACPMHGGELDIHADKVSMESRGFPVHERISRSRINISIAFFILTVLAASILRKRI